MAATPKLFFAALLDIRSPQNRCEPLGGAARPTPALTLLAQKSKQKTATRSLWSNPQFGPNLPYGQFRASALRERYALSSRLGSLRSPFLYCPFSGRRAQSPAVTATGHITPTWLSHGAPFMLPRKRAQGFDVALYRRGAGRLVAAEVDFAASRTSSWHVPSAEKANMLPTV